MKYRPGNNNDYQNNNSNYTSGYQYMTADGKNYKGYFYIKGKTVFAGTKDKINDKIILIDYTTDKNKILYNKITNYKLTRLDNPVEIYPRPMKKDYEKGYYNRYFIQKRNDKNANIYEIDENKYKVFIQHPIYIATKIKWKLTGSYNDIKEKNRISIMNNILKEGLKKKLVNLTKNAKITFK